MKDRPQEYNNDFIEVASYETSALLMNNFTDSEQVTFLMNNRITINKQIEKLQNEINTISKVKGDNPELQNAKVLDDVLLLRKKEQELHIIKDVTKCYSKYLYGKRADEDDYHRQRDFLLKELTVCRAQLHLLTARTMTKKYKDWKNSFVPGNGGWDDVASKICGEAYFADFGILIYQNERRGSIHDNEINDAKEKLALINDDILNNRPILPTTNEEKDTMVLALSNKKALHNKIGELSSMPINNNPESVEKGKSL